ncbi:MAG: carbohydrate kinase family protein [Pseudomonadota bacterium]
MLADRPTCDILCIGGAVMNRKHRTIGPLVAGTSNPSSVSHSFGGVARNVAEVLAKLGSSVGLVSVVGEDEAGQTIRLHAKALGIKVTALAVTADAVTADYTAVFDADGDLAFGLAAMGIFDQLKPAVVDAAWSSVAPEGWIFADCNCSAETLAHITTLAGSSRRKLAVDTVSVAKAQRLPEDLSPIDVLFTNTDEAASLAGNPNTPKSLAKAIQHRGARAVVLTLGSEGHLVCSEDEVMQPPAMAAKVVDVSGAGDALIAGTLYGLMAGRSLLDASRLGAKLAALTVESPLDVRPDISADTVRVD